MTNTFSTARRRAVFWAAVLGYLMSQFYRSFLTVIVDDLARDLGVGPKELGTLGAAWFITFALAQIPVGMMLDRFGPRRTMAGLLFAALGGGLLFAFSTSVLMATVAMALVGLGCSPVLMGALYFFARTETPERFAALGSLFLGVGLVGGLLAATPLALLVQAIGWRHSLLFASVLTALAILLIATVMRDPPSARTSSEAGILDALLTLIRVPGMVPILVMSTFVTAEVWTERSLWVGPFFGEVHGLDPVMRGHVIFAMGLAMAASATLAGPIAVRIGQSKRVVLVATAVSGLGFVGLGLMPQAAFPVAMALMLVVGLFGASYAVLIAHARLFMPPQVIGRGITLINFLSIAMTGILQYASGLHIERMREAGAAPAASFASLHLVFGALMLGAALVYAFAPVRPAAAR